jgi:hypothetical protein
MYSVIKQLDGKYRAEAFIQDGVEKEICDTEEQAVQSCKGNALHCNGTKIKRKDITFRREVQRVVTATERLRRE